MNFLAAKTNRSRIGLYGSRKDFHERAFSRTVFPEESQDFPTVQSEIHLVQRAHAGIGLLDAAHFQQQPRLG